MKKIFIALAIMLSAAAPLYADEAADLYEQGYAALKAEDDARAVPLLEKAYSLGNMQAAYQLGRCYLYGWGVKENYSKAQNFLLKAAGQVPDAQFELYAMYQMDVSTLSAEEADNWMIQAAANDVPDALYEYALYQKRHAHWGKASEAMKKAAELSSPPAMAHMGIALYENEQLWTGRVEGDRYVLAFRFLNELAPQLEDCYLNSETVSAVYLTLGKCYRFGRGCKRNEAKADEYTRLAAKHGNTGAVDIKRILHM